MIDKEQEQMCMIEEEQEQMCMIDKEQDFPQGQHTASLLCGLPM